MKPAATPGIKQWHFYVMLAAVTLITYWPLTFGVFSLKNDAFIYFLPWRFHISESMQNGYFPFWSPYLYTGLPLTSDMQSGTWNPIVLGVSLLTRYNMQVLQWELLLYIFLSGVGMFKLIKEFGYANKAALIGGISYLCCGFITDSGSFIPWITCAAYIPFLFLFFYRLLKQPQLNVSIKLCLVLFLLLTAGYPSYFIYAGYILLAGFICWLINQKRNRTEIIKTLKFLLITALLFLCLAMPVIISFADFLPYYSRGNGATLQQSLSDPFNLFCSISYLFPSAVAKPHEWFHTDIAMRNAYIGIFVLAFFFSSLALPYTKLKKFIIGALLFSFIFSLGDTTPLREWCYKLLPLMNSFRHPAVIRLFTSIGIILIASQAIDKFFNETSDEKRNQVRKILATIIIIIAGFVLYYLLRNNPFKTLFPLNGNAKTILDTVNLPLLVIVEGLIQLLFIVLFISFINRKKRIFWLMALNVIFFAVAALPFSFISQSKTKTIDEYIHSFPKGFPLPDLSDPVFPVNDSSFGIDFADYDKFYNKKIIIDNDMVTPTVNTSYHSFLSDTALRSKLHNLSFAFISSSGKIADSTAHLSITKFSPSHFSFTANATEAGYLNLFQQFHHNWKVKVNHNSVEVEKSFIAFMKVKIPAGVSEITFDYKPRSIVILSMYFSAITFLILLVYLIVNTIKKSKQQKQSVEAINS